MNQEHLEELRVLVKIAHNQYKQSWMITRLLTALVCVNTIILLLIPFALVQYIIPAPAPQVVLPSPD